MEDNLRPVSQSNIHNAEENSAIKPENQGEKKIRLNCIVIENGQVAHNFVNSSAANGTGKTNSLAGSKAGSVRGMIQVQDYNSNNMVHHQHMYSSNDSNAGMSDHQSNGAPMSRGHQRHAEPNVIVQNKDSNRDSNRGNSYAAMKDGEHYGAIGSSQRAGHVGNIMNQRLAAQQGADTRVNKLQKNAYGGKQNMQAFPVKVQNLNQMVHIRKKKPKLKYQDKLQVRAQQERQIYSQQVQHRNEPKRLQKILDGFLLLFSCRVKLPHEAIRSKLSGENIVDVREEDLVYFKQNLKYLDVSDNSIYMEQLMNLQNLEELDMQYNNLDHLELQDGAFPQLQVLHLSYNKIPTSHLTELRYLSKLRVLEIASNDLCTLPSDLSFLRTLEEINLSSNSFSSDSVLVNPSKLFAAIATIPNLKKLNLSRNRFKAFHSEEFPEDNINQEESNQIFRHLEEVNFSFNLVEKEEDLLFCVASLPSMLILTVTGNPFAIRGDPFDTANLEQILSAKNGKLINETLNPPTYLRRQKSKRQEGRPPLMLNYNFPQSRDMVVIKDNQLALSRPAPRATLHQEAEDLFPMPPKDQRIQAIEYEQDAGNIQSEEEEQDQQNDNKFFITEDEMLRGNAKKGQKSQGSKNFKASEVIQEENNDPNIHENQEDEEIQMRQRQEQSHYEQMQNNFEDDFGRIKLDNFKDMCRQILGKPKKNYQNPLTKEFEDGGSDEEDDQAANESRYVKNRDYDTYLDIVNAYKTLKQAVNKPSTVHNPNASVGSKGYLKMTIAATQQSKSKMNRDILEYSLAHRNERVSSTAVGGQRQIAQLENDTNQPLQRPFMHKRPGWRKSKQEVIDEKVERLFESYKIMDEVNKKQMVLQGIKDRENHHKNKNKYFPDDDEDDDE